MDTVTPYLDRLAGFKGALFNLYRDEGAVLERKHSLRAGGTSWGYRLRSWGDYQSGEKMTGTSIGEDEIRIFFDICQLVRPRFSYVVGNGFGLSTFCLALAHPAGQVAALDNWSEGEAGEAARDLSLAIARSGSISDACICTGTSLADLPASFALSWQGPGSPEISLAFIDGMHTDEAARADFNGLSPYLTASSVVLWHNVHATRGAFEESAQVSSQGRWDACVVLRTYGPLGLSFNSAQHPRLLQYLRDMNLIWQDWEKYLRAFMRADRGEPIGELAQLPARQLLRALAGKLAGGLRSGDRGRRREGS